MAESARQEQGNDELEAGVREALVEVTEEEIMFRKQGPRRVSSGPERAAEPSDRAEVPSREAARWPWDDTDSEERVRRRRRSEREYTLWGEGRVPANENTQEGEGAPLEGREQNRREVRQGGREEPTANKEGQETADEGVTQAQRGNRSAEEEMIAAMNALKLHLPTTAGWGVSGIADRRCPRQGEVTRTGGGAETNPS